MCVCVCVTTLALASSNVTHPTTSSAVLPQTLHTGQHGALVGATSLLTRAPCGYILVYIYIYISSLLYLRFEPPTPPPCILVPGAAHWKELYPSGATSPADVHVDTS